MPQTKNLRGGSEPLNIERGVRAPHRVIARGGAPPPYPPCTYLNWWPLRLQFLQDPILQRGLPEHNWETNNGESTETVLLPDLHKLSKSIFAEIVTRDQGFPVLPIDQNLKQTLQYMHETRKIFAIKRS